MSEQRIDKISKGRTYQPPAGTIKVLIRDGLAENAKLESDAPQLTVTIGSGRRRSFAMRMFSRITLTGKYTTVVVCRDLDVGAKIELVHNGEPTGVIVLEPGVQAHDSQLVAAKIDRKH